MKKLSTSDDEAQTTSSSPTSSHSSLLHLRIKSSQEFEVKTPSNSSVSALKDQVRSSLGTSSDRYLRLICKGRLLAPDSAQLSEFGIHDGDVVHAVVAAAGVRGGQQAALSRSSTSRRRGTIVGPGGRVMRSSGDDDEEDQSSSDEETGITTPRLGFDSLRSNGLTRHEITAIRSYFSRSVDRYILAHPNAHSDEPDLSRRRLLNEQDWMNSQGPTSEFRLNLNQSAMMRFPTTRNVNNGRPIIGTDRDFMWGFMLGFFVGFFMIVWIWLPTVPHKQKLGIMTGISFQLALNVFQQEEEDEFLSTD